MQIHFQADPSLDALISRLNELKASNPKLESVLIWAAEGNQWSVDALNQQLPQLPLTLLGGIFPQIIYEQRNLTTGCILVTFETSLPWIAIESLSQGMSAHLDTLATTAEHWEDHSGCTTLLNLVDGLSSGISEWISEVFNQFGLENNILGGGAGSLSLVQTPCLITPKGLLMDAGLLIRLPWCSGLGVSHGWEPISAPYKVTQSHKNTVEQLDWKPAFDVYRQTVEMHSQQTFADQAFFDLAKAYPFGISKLDAELIVRDPLAQTPDKALVCVGDVPEGCFVRILNGTPKSLIEAAAQASQSARANYQKNHAASADALVLIDCISRVLFLGQRIEEEFQAINPKSQPLFGALTLGEIANNGQDYLEFYNKTAVVAVISAQG